MEVGDTVYCRGKAAKVMFIGETTFGTGIWYGIAFQKPYGKNDGSILNQRYFTCAPNHGMFVRESLLSKTAPTDSKGDSRSPSPAGTSAKAQVTRSKARHEAAFSVWNQLDETEESENFERNRDISRIMESELRSRSKSSSKKVGGASAADAFEQTILNEKIPASYKGPHIERIPPTRQECIDLVEWIRDHPDEPLHRKYAWMLLSAGVEIFERTTPTSIFRTSIPSVDPDTRFRVCGDTHGQLNDVLWMFYKSGVPSPTNIYLFNGDIADRGRHAVEILLMLLAFKLSCPESVLINRGNHESPDMNEIYGFADEVKDKYGGQFYLKFLELFYALPLATVVDERVFCVHGGLFRENSVTLERLDLLDRHRPCPEAPRTDEDYLLFDMLWSDPMRDLGRAKSIRGVDCLMFGPDVTSEFCAINNLEVCIRSHQVPSTGRGFEVHHEGKCVTVFSASNYCGTTGNSGAMIVFRPGLTFEVVEHVAPSIEEIQQMARETAQLTSRVSGLVTGISKDDAQRMERRSSAKMMLSAAEKMEAETVKKVARYVAEKKQDLWWGFWSSDEGKLGNVPVAVWRDVCSSVIGDSLPWSMLQQQLRVQVSPEGMVDYNAFLRRFRVVFKPTGSNKPSFAHAKWKQEVIQKVYEAILRADLSLRETLMLVDRNADGTVSFTEFQELLSGLNIGLAEPQVKALMRTIMSAYVVQSPSLAVSSSTAAAAASAAKQHAIMQQHQGTGADQAVLEKQTRVHVAHFLARFKVVFGETMVRCSSVKEEQFVRSALAEIGRLILTEAKQRNDKTKREERRRSSFKSLHLLNKFQLANSAGDGFLSYADFVQCLKSLPLATITSVDLTEDKVLMQLAQAVDYTGSGKINYLEFINAFSVVDSEANAAARTIDGAQTTGQGTDEDVADIFGSICATLYTHKAPLKRALRHFDPKMTGLCSPSDLREALATLNAVLGRDSAPLTMQQIEELVELTDTNSDGFFDYDEFLGSFVVTDSDPQSPINNPAFAGIGIL